MKITAAQLDEIFPNVHGTAELEKFIPALNKVIEEYEINTPKRLAMFIAQTGHESAEYTATEENLNYSAEALYKLFKKYFATLAIAKNYARQPVKIANKMYSNRMGNGVMETGEGWKYRGRGLIQLTGKNNYTEFMKYMKHKSLDETVAYMSTIEGKVVSAAWFWQTNRLNTLSDVSSVRSVTQVINNGVNGLDHRETLYYRAIKVFK